MPDDEPMLRMPSEEERRAMLAPFSCLLTPSGEEMEDEPDDDRPRSVGKIRLLPDPLD